IQFMNYFRDGVPESNGNGFAELPWYISIYCQIDLSVMMPNFSRAISYLEVSFDSFLNAGRSSENPLFSSMTESRLRLASINRFYFNNVDLIDFADWTSKATKPEICGN
ncbi:MAG: hypothetical protein NTV34_01585, partial [Proteobacteria bacterium]|nr:hypothetical protein [Pseudomonadota bacterium]